MKASVIVPAYNAEKTMGKCLSALQAQTFKDFEVIVIDDGSKDQTAEIAAGFKGVKLLKQKNAGPATARNNGAKQAKGKIIVFLDSDCVAEKNWLEEMLAPLENSEIAGVQGTYKNKQKELIARFTHLEIEKRHSKMAKQEFIDFIGSYSAAYRKKVFDEMNGFDTSFPMASGEDTDLSFRINKAGYKMVFNQHAAVYHFHPISLKRYLKVKFFRAYWRTKLYGKHSEKMIKDSYTGQTVKLQTGLFFLICLSLFLAPFGVNGVYFALVLFGALLVSTVPFAIWAGGHDLAVGLIAPPLIVARTVMFGFGLTIGFIKQLRDTI
ncbi:MAG: glycosyltransferase [archaeon]|jgi:glycosyltransferase involved in cell wall biosynthesis|nr:glycosyltransferase [archaeon]